MSGKRSSKFERLRAFLAGFLVFIGIFTGVGSAALQANEVHAISNNENTVLTSPSDSEDNNISDERTAEENAESDENTSTTAETNNTTTTTDNKSKGDTCKDSLGALGWLVCPATGAIAKGVDFLYNLINDFLVINPISTDDGTPVYEIWKYCRGVTNVVFIIFLLIVIYSQITGIGISNYGIKKSLPKLIVAAILVNLSFIICLLAVDASNIIGNSLRGLFNSVQETVLANNSIEVGAASYTGMYSAIAGGTALAIGGAAIAFDAGAIWMLIPTALGALVAAVTGLITIALRQAVVVLLIMIAPLAMVANILPNTEKWFKKWKDLLTKMLVFYPMFSLLFGASSLAGFAIMMSAKSGWGLLLGTAVQIFPLFFSWSLMKMSGTFLGDINSKVRGLAARPLAANRAWADGRRQATNLNFLAYGRTPTSRIRRSVYKRKALRDQHVTNLRTKLENEANVYAQRKISGGYDGSKAQGTSAYLKPNKYTRAAKDASTSNLHSQTATMDTAHVLSNYGSYFVSKDVRDRLSVAGKIKDSNNREAAIARINASDAEANRSAKSAQAFLEYSRAQMTAENDSEADFNFMVGQFLGASMGYDPNKVDTEVGRKKMEKYYHYIVSSAGGLGETGQTRVLGKIIARAAAVESNQRRDINIVANKFPPDKRNFRNFLFNYYIDDDGYATDKEGNRIEKIRDYLRVNDPSKLVKWEQCDENGPYFDWYDVNGNYVTRIYKKDSSAIKELMSNFDAPINDPINNMLAIHAGIKEQPDSDIPVLQHMGLDKFRTTVGRALLSAPFKEKNAAFSPMVAEMVKKGYIQNYAQEYLAYLDSLNKATKPGAFNTQDGDAIDMFAMIMNPDKWEEIFPTELIRGYRNVNGERIYGIRIDENGNRTKVSADEATREELMERIKEKYIIPAGKKITVMMSRQTQNTMDNQKAGTAEKWKNLKEVFDTKWGEDSAVGADPYRQDGDMREIAKGVKDSLYTVDENGNRQTFGYNNRANQSRRSDALNNTGIGVEYVAPTHHLNHEAETYNIFNSALDSDDFAVTVSEYLKSHQETAWIAEQLQDYIISEGYGATKEQLFEKVEELLAYVDYD